MCSFGPLTGQTIQRVAYTPAVTGQLQSYPSACCNPLIHESDAQPFKVRAYGVPIASLVLKASRQSAQAHSDRHSWHLVPTRAPVCPDDSALTREPCTAVPG